MEKYYGTKAMYPPGALATLVLIRESVPFRELKAKVATSRVMMKSGVQGD